MAKKEKYNIGVGVTYQVTLMQLHQRSDFLIFVKYHFLKQEQ